MWAAPRWLPLDGPNPFQAEADAGPAGAAGAERRAPADDPRDRFDRRPERWGQGDVGVTVRDLGIATGSVLSGLNEVVVEPGRLSGPPHCHSSEDELFLVTAGDGTLELTDTAGEDAGRHELRAGHVVSLPAASRDLARVSRRRRRG